MDLKHHDVKYKRWIYLTVTFVIILAGLASRKYGNALLNYCRVYWRYTLGSYGLLGITLSLPFGIHTQSDRNLLTVFLLHRNQPIIPGRLGECHTKHHARSIGLRAWIFMVGYDMLYCRGNVICHRRFLRFLFFFG